MSSSYYFSKNTFDCVSKAMLLDAITEALAMETADQIGGVVDEKYGVRDVVFLG